MKQLELLEMDKFVNVYEVVRVINSKPLFLSAHYQRFIQSLSHFKLCLTTEDYFFNEICNIILIKEISYGNIRIDTFIDPDTPNCEIHIKQIPHHYPSNEQYKNGVKVISYPHERPSPQRKIWHADIRQKIDDIIKSGKCYEVLYYNKSNILTEGSRSNLFFIKDEKIFTPKQEHVLPGITKNNIIKLAKKMGFEIIETEIPLIDIVSFDSAFISGTSPNILPIKEIDGYHLDVNNKCLRSLMKEFDGLIQLDIRNFKKCKSL